MARDGQTERARRAILARRARFVAAALASSGIAVSAHVGARPDEEGGTSDAPTDCETDDTPRCAPRICLSDIDIEGELVQQDGGAGTAVESADSGEPLPGPLDGPVPQVCLSIAPPSTDLPRQHDGFYLRLSLAPALMTGALDGGGSYHDVGFGGGVAFGMTLLPGTVFGLSGRVAHAPSASPSASSGLLEIHMGPFVDLYPSARDGFHVAVSPEAAIVSAGDRRFGGAGGAVWLGYDAWIGDDGSLGIGLRGDVAWLGGDGDRLVTRNLGLDLSALWH